MLLGETQTAGFYDQALWSPNNRYILLHSGLTRLPGRRHIYVMDTDGSQWRLTNGTDQEFAPAVGPGARRIANLPAGEILGIGGNSIFEIEDQGVGRNRAGFFQGAGIRAGHIENAAAGAGWSWRVAPVAIEGEQT